VKQFHSQDFQEAINVPRETIDRLTRYADLLIEKNKSQNLVSKSTIDQIWHRHFFDSAQLASLAPNGSKLWLDLGSGAGFPGLVLSILGVGEVHLVERSVKKAEFLSEVAEITEANVKIHPFSIEELHYKEFINLNFDIITSRAVAKPGKILQLTEFIASPTTIYLLPVGRGAEMALTELKESWKLASEIIPSRTDPNSSILLLREVYRNRTNKP